MQITVDTPVEDILDAKGNKPLMVKLAQAVFDRTGLEYFRAFSQFRNVEDLASLIEAKRKNVFDYSVCLQSTSNGIRFPKNTTAIMTALKHAMDGKYDSIDFRAIGLVDADGEPVATITDLCPGSTATPASRKKPAKVEPKAVEPVEEEPEGEETSDAVEEPEEEEEVAEPEQRRPGFRRQVAGVPERKVEAAEEVQHAVLIGSDEVLARLDQLSGDLAEALQTVVEENRKAAHAKNDMIEDEIGWVKNEVENLKAGVVGLASFLNVVNENIKMMFMYIDPVEELQGPPEEVLQLLGMAVPDDIDERLEAVEAKSEKPEVVEEEQAPPEPAPREKKTTAKEKKEPVVEDDQSEAFPHSRDDLLAMALDELNEIALQVGARTPDKTIPFKTSAVNRIAAAVGL